MLALVRRARRRILHNLLFYEGANAASAALFVFTLLLVFGTQVLSWYWAVLLPGAAAALAAWRVRRRLPSMYVTAQRVDRRMRLADSLSTALYFDTKGARASANMRARQREEADRMAAGLDVRQAAPYQLPRTAYITAALLLIASSLFALRYGLMDRLDLKPPLASILRESLGLPERGEEARLDRGRDPSQSASDDLLNADQGQATDRADPDEQPGDAAESDSTETQKAAAREDAKSKNSDGEDASEDGQADPTEQPADSRQSASAKDGKDGKDPGSSGANAQSQQSNQSLLSKMKEAMENLLSSIQPNSRDQQSVSNQTSKGGKSQQNQNKRQAKGEKSKSQSGDSQDQQSADEGQEAQNTPGQSPEQQDSPLANKQPGSGAGNRDGAKDIRQAEQIAAMGKISQIIGKRSANVTGEATVDVNTTSQELRTGYQQRNADHAQAGAEIHRDEIPVALESYVEQYFEQVRKQAPKN